MKKILSMMVCFVAILSSISLSSCSKDDDEPVQTNPIVGCWSVTSFDGEATPEGAGMYYIFTSDSKMYSYTVYEGTEVAEDATYVTSDGTMFVINYYGTYSTSYKIEGNSLTLTTEDNAEIKLIKCAQPITTEKLQKLVNAQPHKMVVGTWKTTLEGGITMYQIYKSNGTVYFYEKSAGTQAAGKGTWKYNGDTLTIDISNLSVMYCTINTLTETTLSLTENKTTTELTKTTQPLTDAELDQLCKDSPIGH